MNNIKRMLRRLWLRLAQALIDRGIGDTLLLYQVSSIGQDDPAGTRVLTLSEPETVAFEGSKDDPFLKICRYFSSGEFQRKRIFVAELKSVTFFPDTGVVCLSDGRICLDSVMEEGRLDYTGIYKHLRPLRLTRYAGLCSSIQHVFGSNFWHWFVDCLPQILSLKAAAGDRQVSLLMPSSLSDVQRESLGYLLPPNFQVHYVPPKKWIHAEQFLLPSYVSARCNGHLPARYLEFIRQGIFEGLGTPESTPGTRRLYFSRAGARHRRVLNEDQVMEVLGPLGFERILIEKYTFREQVALFREAAAVVAPHGAALGGLIFSGELKLCVFYPDAHPREYFYTLAKGLGQSHFYLAHNGTEFDDIQVDIPTLEHVIKREMRLTEGDQGFSGLETCPVIPSVFKTSGDASSTATA